MNILLLPEMPPKLKVFATTTLDHEGRSLQYWYDEVSGLLQDVHDVWAFGFRVLPAHGSLPRGIYYNESFKTKVYDEFKRLWMDPQAVLSALWFLCIRTTRPWNASSLTQAVSAYLGMRAVAFAISKDEELKDAWKKSATGPSRDAAGGTGSDGAPMGVQRSPADKD